MAYQSQTWIGDEMLVPRMAAGSSPPETNAVTRRPPSNRVYFPPRRGKFDAAFWSLKAGPPLSEETTKRVFSHMLFAFKAVLTLWMAWKKNTPKKRV